jgi:hypothetical protein
MANGIIHHNGVYNIWSTVMDSPLFVSGLTHQMVVDYIREKHGEEGLRMLPERFEQAHKSGCDDMRLGHTLEDLIACNRAGPNQSNMSKDEFLKKFFTIETRFLRQEN